MMWAGLVLCAVGLFRVRRGSRRAGLMVLLAGTLVGLSHDVRLRQLHGPRDQAGKLHVYRDRQRPGRAGKRERLAGGAGDHDDSLRLCLVGFEGVDVLGFGELHQATPWGA